MDEPKIIFGANVIENLTTGMYKDSKIIFREYIQNSCDQIDKAVKLGLLKDRSAGKIEIFIDKKKRVISVEDNATGIPANLFISTLADVANSSKKIGKDKGFRGIGRLAGLAYCKKLIFSSSAKGENMKSIMVCDADLMRKMLNENVQGIKHTAQEILHAIYFFSTEKENTDEHYFKVEMLDINQENTELLDREKIQNYLSFVSPVPFINNFFYRKDIYNYAKENNYEIDEYVIKINGKQIFKQYSMNYKTYGNGKDSIRGIEFHTFVGDDGQPLAWMWFGRSDFKGAIPESCPMRYIRIRDANIQIGNESTFQQFFTEERGAKYFVGEVHILSTGMIPNSQRDYFNETDIRVNFENVMKKFANKELNPIYHKGSEMNTHISNMRKADEQRRKLEEKNEKLLFLGNEEARANAEKNLKEAEEKSEMSRKKTNNLINREPDSDAARIIGLLAKSRLDEYEKEKSSAEKAAKKEVVKKTSAEMKPKKGKNAHRTDNLNRLNKNERKLIEKVYVGVQKALNGNDELIECVIKAIEVELK